jgi:hypothetical protein
MTMGDVFLKGSAVAVCGLVLGAVQMQGQSALPGQATGTPPASGYQGVSKPPSDVIETSPEPAPMTPPIPKPSAAVVAPQPTSMGPVAPPDSGVVAVQVAPPTLQARPDAMADPDADIVHPRVARPGELVEGTTIRVKLLDRLSSTESEKGDVFRGQVASEVIQDGNVLIPAGAGIEGRVSQVSTGKFGGHGSLRLRPEAVIMPDGTRFELHAETTGTPGSRTRMGAEGSINPGPRVRKDSIEYGALVGAGAITGAVVAGPVGALTGGLVGAGIVTTHILVDHPQTTLEPGTVLLFTTTAPLQLSPALQ